MMIHAEHSIKAVEMLDILATRLIDDLPFEGINFLGYDCSSNKLFGLAAAGILLGPRVREWVVDGPPIVMPKKNIVSEKDVETFSQKNRVFNSFKETEYEHIRPLWAAKEFLYPLHNGAGLDQLIKKELSNAAQGNRGYTNGKLIRPVSEDIITKFFEFSSPNALKIGTVGLINDDNSNSAWNYHIEKIPEKIQNKLLDPIKNVAKKEEDTDSIISERSSYTEGSNLEEILSFPLIGRGTTESEKKFEGLLSFNNPNPAVFSDKVIEKLVIRETTRMSMYTLQVIRDLRLTGNDYATREISLHPLEYQSAITESIEKLTETLKGNDPTEALEKIGKLELSPHCPIILELKGRITKMLSDEKQAIEFLISKLCNERKRVAIVLKCMVIVLSLLAIEALIVWLTK